MQGIGATVEKMINSLTLPEHIKAMFENVKGFLSGDKNMIEMRYANMLLICNRDRYFFQSMKFNPAQPELDEDVYSYLNAPTQVKERMLTSMKMYGKVALYAEKLKKYDETNLDNYNNLREYGDICRVMGDQDKANWIENLLFDYVEWRGNLRKRGII